MNKLFLAVLMAGVSFGAVAKPTQQCMTEGAEEAKEVVVQYADAMPGNTDIIGNAKYINTISNPAAKGFKWDVVEYWGETDRAVYRVRLYFDQSQSQYCATAGHEVIVWEAM